MRMLSIMKTALLALWCMVLRCSAMPLHLFSCGLTVCSMQGYGQYCEDGRCESCERYFDICKNECDRTFFPVRCQASLYFVDKMSSPSETSQPSQPTELPVKETCFNDAFSGREYLLLGFVLLMTVVCCALTVILSWQRRKTCCSKNCPENGSDADDDCDPMLNKCDCDPKAPKCPESCPAKQMITGVDETGDDKSAQVTSKD